MTYTTAVCTVKNSYDGQRNCPKHVEFYYKNKFEKLVHLVGFIIRNYKIYLYISKTSQGTTGHHRNSDVVTYTGYNLNLLDRI